MRFAAALSTLNRVYAAESADSCTHQQDYGNWQRARCAARQLNFAIIYVHALVAHNRRRDRHVVVPRGVTRIYCNISIYPGR